MASMECIIKVKQSVIDKFTDLKSALMMREKLLLRQLEVIDTTSKQQMQQQQQQDAEKLKPCIEFLGDNEQELLAAIRNYGRYQMTNLNLALQDIYLRNEDYIKPTDDHETMFKDLSNKCVISGTEEQKESIVVDFSHHKTLMERNARQMNESIVKFTLKEAKELIKQAKMKREMPVPPLNLEELDDEVESSIEEVVSSLGANSEHYANNKYSQTKKQKRFNPKITINNCNGTINLRNIASLTINCSNEDNIQAQIPVSYPKGGHDNESVEGKIAEEDSISPQDGRKNSAEYDAVKESLISSTSFNTDCTSPASTTPNCLSSCSSNNSSRSQSKKQKPKKLNPKTEKNKTDSKVISTSSSNHEYPVVESTSSNDVTCDFYNRLLNEIKRTIHQQQKTDTKYSTASEQCDEAAAIDSTTFSSCRDDGTDNPSNQRLVLKNFENLKIILEANSSGDEESFHPIQIEQWLAEIISETDLEPMLNRDILEHSKLFDETQEI